MANFNTWFETFIDEKNIPFVAWDIEHDGMTHHIDNDVVIEAIKCSPAGEQAQIKNTLVRIDFVNGDVNHFFRHLAGALVANH